MLFFLCRNESSFGFLDHYRKKQKWCRVRLCGVCKKNIWGAVNLHKLSGKSPETVMEQMCPIVKDYPFRNEPLFPVVQEGSDDMAAVALVNGRVVIHKDFPSFPIFM